MAMDNSDGLMMVLRGVYGKDNVELTNIHIPKGNSAGKTRGETAISITINGKVTRVIVKTDDLKRAIKAL